MDMKMVQKNVIFDDRKSILKIKDGGYENGIKKLVFDDDDVFS